MVEKAQDRFWRQNNPIMWGVLATASVVAFGAWTAAQPVCQTYFWFLRNCSGTKWAAFLDAGPNEVGDTLAGFAGALAFVWLISTVWLQGQELVAQRKELVLSRAEYEKMVIAMEAQAVAMGEQSALFTDERKQREYDRAARHLQSLLEGLVGRFEAQADFENNGDNSGSSFGSVFVERKGRGVNEYLEASLSRLSLYWDLVDEGDTEVLAPDKVFENNRQAYALIYEIACSISAIRDSLEVDQRQRLRNLNFDDLKKQINRFRDAVL
ncbi:MAG: hypothetical protein MRY77_06310 [Rhodobacteraceae bacterium]|nr:hypothetical protein [Paracoccaceae bacterium]